MPLDIKYFVRKSLSLQGVIFRFRTLTLYLKYFFSLDKHKNKVDILVHKHQLNDAHIILEKSIIQDNEKLNHKKFIQYLSLSMRLKKINHLKIILKKIITYNCWDPITYVFLLNFYEYKILAQWIIALKNKNIEIFLDLKKKTLSEKKFIRYLSKLNNTDIENIRVEIKLVIQAMYFNDKVSNELYYLSILDIVISDYLNLKNKKINSLKRYKKCAIINLDPWTQSIGHFYYVDSFIKGVLLKILDYDYVKFSSKSKNVISNKYLYDLYDDALKKKFPRNSSDRIIYYEPNLDVWRKANDSFDYQLNIATKIQKIWLKKNLRPLIEIRQKDKKLGKKLISKITKKNWFVTLQVREAGYRHNDYLSLDTGRNARLQSYSKAISYISKKNGCVIRLGQKIEKKIKSKNFIDYGSSKYKSEFLDIYIISKAKFHIGTVSGLSFIPIIFGKTKNVLTNINPPNFAFGLGSIGVPKLYKSIKNKKFLRYTDYQKLDPPHFFSGNTTLKNIDLKVYDNKQNDIFEAVKELNENFENKNWFKELRKRQTYVSKYSKNIFLKNRIPLAKMFIKRYKHLL